MKKEYYAHITNDGEKRKQTNEEHLNSVSKLSADYGKTIGISNTLSLIGIAHDLGKYSDEFQTYLENAAQNEKVHRGSVNHSAAGARLLMDSIICEDIISNLSKEIIAGSIISHHGLHNYVNTEGKNEFWNSCYSKKSNYEEVYGCICKKNLFKNMDESFKRANSEIKELYLKIMNNIQSSNDKEIEGRFELSALFRLILSCLIAADRNDTRAFMLKTELPKERDTQIVWDKALIKLEAKLSQFKSDGNLSDYRKKISEECKAFANNGASIYRLSCPTGSGKTLSALRFALYHAKKYNKKHIIYIAPYKSILTQNSMAIKEYFEEDDVLEHHTDFIPDDKEKYEYLNSNWSSQVICTTAVQFYLTLFSHKTTSIRRFHQLADSVIIIDEAQNVPVQMISMFNYMMNFLSEICNSTIVLCSATQPLFEKTNRAMRLANQPDIVINNKDILDAFKRVHLINDCTEKGFDTDEYANFILEKQKKHASVLAIVNTKTDALNIFQACKKRNEEVEGDIFLYHLTTNMCPAHRDECLEKIKKNLKKNQNVICIATSLIECGVDVSFPSIIRSVTGLDSIAQSAGRCNREKIQDYGYLYIVKSQNEKISRLQSVKEGQQVMISLLSHFEKEKCEYDDLLLPEMISKYYENLYFHSNENMDYEIKELNGDTQINLWAGAHKAAKDLNQDDCKTINRSALRTAGEKLNLIEQTIGILVPYDKGNEYIKLFNSDKPDKEKFEKIRESQRYAVQVYENKYHELMDAGLIECLSFADILVLKGDNYDDEVGLMIEKDLQDLFI